VKVRPADPGSGDPHEGFARVRSLDIEFFENQGFVSFVHDGGAHGVLLRLFSLGSGVDVRQPPSRIRQN
jgi:hypothetical protein